MPRVLKYLVTKFPGLPDWPNFTPDRQNAIRNRMAF